MIIFKIFTVAIAFLILPGCASFKKREPSKIDWKKLTPAQAQEMASSKPDLTMNPTDKLPNAPAEKEFYNFIQAKDLKRNEAEAKRREQKMKRKKYETVNN